jgi:hypothetical protein
MNCSHITKVLEWGFTESHEFAVNLYGCVLCDETSPVPFKDEERVSIDHTHCDSDPCFGCKAKNLQLSVGETRHDGVMTAKQHDKELGSYYDALRQGVEPVSTKQKDIDAAVRISNDTGVAFNGNEI